MSAPMRVTPLRRAHATVPFGVGALTLTRDGIGVVVAGLKLWMDRRPTDMLDNPQRLDLHSLRERHLETGWKINRIVTAPAVEDADKANLDFDWVIPAARFPLAESCTNYRCQRMSWRSPSDPSAGSCDLCTDPLRHKKKWRTLQVPLVRACRDGHIDDVDWVAAAHEAGHGHHGGDDGGTGNGTAADEGWETAAGCSRSDIRYQVGASPDRPVLTCTRCGSTGTFDPTKASRCTGRRPWLATLVGQRCVLRMQPVERSSVSAYFASTDSSITIPLPGADNPGLLKVLTEHASARAWLSLPYSNDIERLLLGLCASLGVLTDAAELRRHVDAVTGEDSEGPSRARELEALTSDRHPRRSTTRPPDLIVEVQDPAAYATHPLTDRLTAISLVPRLRETRILTGFSRLQPSPTGDPDAGYEQLWGQPRPSAGESLENWLPGHQVFGEGILLELEQERVLDWAQRAACHPRFVEAADAGNSEAGAPALPWLLAHTLAHLVMRAAAPHCGYPLPSLRERIYVTHERTALLVYTAAGDAHGTLGGLAELGTPERLPSLLEEAVRSASWCPTDPVCSEDRAWYATGTAPGACHHCMLVPETSCESFNRGLDRAVLLGNVGTVPDRALAFLPGAVDVVTVLDLNETGTADAS